MKTHTTTDRDSVESTDLFDLGSVRMDSPRLKEIKEHDIQTHHAPHMEEAPWLAIPMKAARELLAGYDLTEDEKNNLPAMMAGYCLLLDESGMIFEGDSEREVQDAALDFCRSNNGDCHLCKVCREIGELDKAGGEGMTYASVCSGIEAASVAWELLEITKDQARLQPSPEDGGSALGGGQDNG